MLLAAYLGKAKEAPYEAINRQNCPRRNVGDFCWCLHISSDRLDTADGANKSVAKKTVGIQLAQADEKADEMHDAADGAKNAVVSAHRAHERNEYRHRTIGSKIDSKISEVKNEARGAGHAVERAHERHEAVERSEGRD